LSGGDERAGEDWGGRIVNNHANDFHAFGGDEQAGGPGIGLRIEQPVGAGRRRGSSEIDTNHFQTGSECHRPQRHLLLENGWIGMARVAELSTCTGSKGAQVARGVREAPHRQLNNSTTGPLPAQQTS
jgi:hypothetical protein